MISLEQIKLLEKKVNTAVHLIQVLKDENKTLKRTIESSQKRMQELEELINAFKTDQNEIEKSVLGAIQKLDILEDKISREDEISAREDGEQNSVKDSAQEDLQSEEALAESSTTQTESKLEPEHTTSVTTEEQNQNTPFTLEPEEAEEEEEIIANEASQQVQDNPTVEFIEYNDLDLGRAIDTAGTKKEQSDDKTNEQSDLLFSSQYNSDNERPESFAISYDEDETIDADGHHQDDAPHHLGVHHLFQNKIYVQRQTEYKELDIF